MRVILALLIAVFAVCANSTNDPKYCYSSDSVRSQLGKFSTTTPYNAVRGSAFNPSLCIPKRFWFLTRHGSRYPSVADHDTLLTTGDPLPGNIVRNFEAGKTTLCEQDAKNIKEWSLDPVMLRSDSPAELAASGREEVKAVATRYQSIFPTLLPRTYSQTNYFFRNSPVLRTRQTAEAFAEGLFGAPGFQQVNYTGGSYPDVFLYSFGSCTAWSDIVMNSLNQGGGEFQTFANGPQFQAMITQVSNKLGFFGSEQLSISQIASLMTHCQYEQILNPNKPSPFCSAFSDDNVQVYEYYKDLQFDFTSGYGNTQYRNLYRNMNCHLVKDMLNYLQANDNQKALLNFGHDVTVHFFMVALGLFEDTVPLTANNFGAQLSRKWRTSLITPMAANLAVVRYNCLLGEDEVLFELNEKPLLIPGCNANGICKISTVLNRLSYFAQGNCDTLYCRN